MFALILKYLPIFRVLAVLATFFTYMGWVYHKGVTHEQNKQEKQIIKEVTAHDKIKQEVMGLSCADVHKRMQRYYRD